MTILIGVKWVNHMSKSEYNDRCKVGRLLEGYVTNPIVSSTKDIA